MGRRWQQWVDPRVSVSSRWHSKRVGLVRSPVILGDHLVSQLRELARCPTDDMAVARTGQFLTKKLRAFERENRLLLRLADSARVLLLLQRTIESFLGMEDNLESGIRETWDRNLESERNEWIQEIENVLNDDEKMEMEMGDDKQQLRILALLKHELDHYSHVLKPRELDIVSEVFHAVTRRGNVVVGRLPDWFATSELEWFRAKTTMVEEGEEACERQAAVWAKLHHPNVRKFFGACHVGDAFVIHEACSELPLSKQNMPRRTRTRRTRAERAMAKRMGKSKARTMGKATQTWGHLLGCALGLQYVHNRGLVHEGLSAGYLLYSQASQKGILSGMGLVLQRELTSANSDEPDAVPSVLSDILAFGLAIFEIIVKDRSHGIAEFVVFDRLPDDRPNFIKQAEWDLLEGMCTPNLAARSCVADVVHQISVLARRSPDLAAKVPTIASATIENVSEYEIQTLGMTFKDALEEIEMLCDGDDSFSVGNVSRPVYDRLVDIYQQLLGSSMSATIEFMENFSLIVLRFFDMLDQYSLGGSSVIASMCASGTVAGKNYGLHHDIDMLLRNSDLQSSPPVHNWQTTWKENKERHSLALKICWENPDSLLSQVSNDVDRSEALALLRFEASTRIGSFTGAFRSSMLPSSLVKIDETEEFPLWFIPPYQVQLGKHIADGSFGAVYEGEWLDTDVVVKQLLLDQANRENWEQFRCEADLWFSLNHPNLIKLYGACHQGRPFFVCETANHGTLASYLKGKNRRTIWYAIGDAALGLQHLHDHDIVHGDLKGNNILVCDRIDGLPSAKLADFGLSIVTTQAASPATEENGVLGAFRWKSPECLTGARPTFASDIYSFGMCIIEAITGQYPWGNTMPDSVVVRNVVDARLLPVRPDCMNDEEWKLVTRMCCYEPTHRIPIGAVINCAFNLAA